MEVFSTELEGVKILVPELFKDSRGYFFETFNNEVFEKHFGPVAFCQDNQSLSHRNVIRGLHFQEGSAAQSKLVRTVKGVIWDVVVDIKKTSPTFKRWIGTTTERR